MERGWIRRGEQVAATRAGDRSRVRLGRWAEDRAVAHLRSLGMTILERNWRSPEREVGGELDVVAQVGDLVVVCEVKARRAGSPGGALAAVGASKQATIRALAESWLRVRGVGEVDVRFDVIAVDGVKLAHHPAAF